MDATFDYNNVNGLAKALGGRVDLLEKLLGVETIPNQ